MDIKMRSGNVHNVVTQAETALLEAKVPIYQRGGNLVRPIRLEEAGVEGGVRRKGGCLVLTKVQEIWLLEQMNRYANWKQARAVPGSKGEVVEWIDADPKPIYPHALVGRSGEWRFPHLRGILTCPTLTREGRVLETSGYDETSGLYLDIGEDQFPKMPQEPDKDQALEALKILANPLREMPWDGPGARSVGLSAMLTALIRPSIRTSPLHVMDSSQAGNGKSMMAECVGLLSMGYLPPAMSQGKSPEEDEKRLSTVLFAGDPIIHIDNCDTEIRGDFLCSMLTQEVVQARILGMSERRVLPSTALVIASGNNVTIAGDVSRRAVTSRIDSHLERPDLRVFNFHPHNEIREDREKMVIAGLTVLQAYLVAGKPERLPAMGSFDDWEWVRGALVWLGEDDPAVTRDGVFKKDPVRDELLAIMRLWDSVFKNRKVRVSDLAGLDDNDNDPDGHGRQLKEAMIEATEQRVWSAKSVGKWLSRKKGRVIEGRYFEVFDVDKTGRQWVLMNSQKQLF